VQQISGEVADFIPPSAVLRM